MRFIVGRRTRTSKIPSNNDQTKATPPDCRTKGRGDRRRSRPSPSLGSSDTVELIDTYWTRPVSGERCACLRLGTWTRWKTIGDIRFFWERRICGPEAARSTRSHVSKHDKIPPTGSKFAATVLTLPSVGVGVCAIDIHPNSLPSRVISTLPLPSKCKNFFPLLMMADQSGSTHFRPRFESALQAYQETTGVTLAEHPLTVQLRNPRSVESEFIRTILQCEARASSDLLGSDRTMRSIESIVSMLFTLSAASSFGDAIELVRT
jgi:hypothetical protein